MPLDLKAHLTQLSEAIGPSGHEAPVAEVIRAAWAGLVDDFQTDGLGSLIAIKHGSGPEPRRRVMLCAHMDEIGLMVADVCDGFILTTTLGGIDYRSLLMQPVIVHGQRPLQGVFGAAPPHMSRDRSKYPAQDELWIDVGLPPEEVAGLVRIGDLITFDSPAVELKNDRLAGKSLDNRASVAALTLCLDELSRRDHAWDVYAVASVQEEVGSYGAAAAAFRIEPDIAIAIDTTFGEQNSVGGDESFELGDGPTLGVGPNFHPLLVKQAREVADDHDIEYQIEALPGSSGTDAWAIQVSRSGVPSVLFSIPIRNMHSPTEIVALRDVTWTGRWMAYFVAGLAPDFLQAIAWPTAGDHAAEGGTA